jgi:hypothetical protein
MVGEVVDRCGFSVSALPYDDRTLGRPAFIGRAKQLGCSLQFGDDVEVGGLSRLVAAEQHCCAFFSFALAVDQRSPALEVRAPEAVAGIVADLFGRAA